MVITYVEALKKARLITVIGLIAVQLYDHWNSTLIFPIFATPQIQVNDQH